MQRARIAIALLLLSGAAAAETIDPAEFMPLGAFNRWQFVRDGDTSDTVAVMVKNVTVVKGSPRYNIRLPKVGDLDEVRLVLGFEDGKLLMYAANVTYDLLGDDVALQRIEFDDPVLIAAFGTQIDAPDVVTDVDTRIDFSVKVGPKRFKGHIDVDGTVGAGWSSLGQAVTTPYTEFPAVDVARLAIDFQLDLFSNDVPKYDVDKSVSETVELILAKGVGVAKFVAGSRTYLLNKAILPGLTLGDFPPNADIDHLAIPTPGLLILQDAAGLFATDGKVGLTDLYLEHKLSGKLVLEGMLDVVTDPAAESTAVRVVLKGKARAISGGGAKVVLKGKVKHPALAKKISLKAVATVDAATTSIALLYKAGKDEAGNLIAGELDMPLLPRTANSAVVTLNGLVDARLEPNLKKRKLGTEGILAVAGLEFPVTLVEYLKAKEGLPDRRTYKMVETGTDRPVVARFSASSTGADYDLEKFTAKLLGIRVKPEDLAAIVD